MTERKTKNDNTQEENVQEENVQKREWVIAIKDNPSFCGVGAGGIQFANGKAETGSSRMAEWFREHDGYKVSEK